MEKELNKSLGLFLLIGIFLISLVSAYSWGGYYGSWGSSWDVEGFLDNPTFIFIGVFILVFALSYIALGRFFSKKEKSKFPWEEDKIMTENNGVLIVMALAIAFFSASAAVRSQWMMQFFGEALSGFVLLMLFVVMIILLVPFYKSLRDNIGRVPGIIIFILALWGIIKYMFNPDRIYDLLRTTNVDLYQFYDFYDFVTAVPTLIIALIVGVIYGVIKGKKKKSGTTIRTR
ncbi:MAG: hypothetical protein ACOCUU_03575 [Nanoarchaeota archaeon]